MAGSHPHDMNGRFGQSFGVQKLSCFELASFRVVCGLEQAYSTVGGEDVERLVDWVCSHGESLSTLYESCGPYAGSVKSADVRVGQRGVAVVDAEADRRVNR
ncbi:hypothetical protein NWFMUON74_11650 [Nocardia wallacei]|uniref:Uncharacterized protein n=1 Tax=Nocardia wallacei TaxID=480035 RepID=A0A7G1KGL2_9NOCA|nr:hypothetical protein NWFMUON74_11650 [Nocardia wallacei]